MHNKKKRRIKKLLKKLVRPIDENGDRKHRLLFFYLGPHYIPEEPIEASLQHVFKDNHGIDTEFINLN